MIRFRWPGLVTIRAETIPWGGTRLMKSRMNSSRVWVMRSRLEYRPLSSSSVIFTLKPASGSSIRVLLVGCTAMLPHPGVEGEQGEGLSELSGSESQREEEGGPDFGHSRG